jgi:hypothetical protein
MEPENKTNNKIVQTYAEDMAQVLENDTEGLVKKIIHGEEEHEEEKKNLSPESKKNKIFLFVSLILILISIGTLAFFFLKEDVKTVPVEKQFVPLIFTDQSTFVEIAGLKKDEITHSVLNEVNNTKVKIGGVKGIYLTSEKQIVGLRQFLSLIKSSFVPDQDTSLVGDNFMIGSMLTGLKSTSPTAGDFFILLKVRSTADIFEAMRAWEGKMFTDLRGFLGINISSEINYLFTKNFEDSIVDNKNTRVLNDKEGNPVLMYVYADDNSVIITGSQSIVREIILRLASAQNKQ